MMTFREFLTMQEGLFLPDRSPAKGLPRLNTTSFTNADRRRLHAKPVKPSKPFAPTVRRVAEIVPPRFVAKL